MKPVLALILGLVLAYFCKGFGDNADGFLQTWWYIVSGGFVLAGVVSFIGGMFEKKPDDAVLVVVETEKGQSWDQKLISFVIRILIVVVVLIVGYGFISNYLG